MKGRRKSRQEKDGITITHRVNVGRVEEGGEGEGDTVSELLLVA